MRPHRLATFTTRESVPSNETLSDFKAGQLLDFFVRELGPPVYNQAIRDAHGFVRDKLEDLEGEFYEPDDTESG